MNEFEISNSELTTSFYVKFDGDALKTHEMNITDIAPSLIALEELIKSANELLNKGAFKSEVSLVGGFESGSFKYLPRIKLENTENLVNLLTGKRATAICNAAALITVLGFNSQWFGLADLIKILKGKEVIEAHKNGDIHKIKYEGGHVEVNGDVYLMYNDMKTRQKMEDLLAPLDKKGIDNFKTSVDNIEYKTITSTDYQYFKLKDGEKTEDTYRRELWIIKPSLIEDYSWTFNDGINRFSAIVIDDAFLEKVDNQEVQFKKGDILDVDLKVVSYLHKGRRDTKRYITKVHKKKNAPEQLKLFPVTEEPKETRKQKRRKNN